MTALRTRICTRLSDVGPPEAWDALSARPPASLSGSRSWAAAAFAAAHPRAAPIIVAVEARGQLLGLLALALHDTETGPTLRLAGAPHNDLTDVMVLRGHEEEVARAVITELSGLARRGWAVWLEAIDPSGALAHAAKQSKGLCWTPGEPAPMIRLDRGWRSAPSSQRRSQWDHQLRRLRDDHEVEFRRVDGPEMLRDLSGFVAMREARLRRTGRPLDLPPVTFMTHVVTDVAGEGRCAFTEMLLDGHVAARDLYQVRPPVAMLWLRALDAAWQRFSPGHLLLHASAEAFADEGYEILDLGRGNEPYKFVFGAEPRVLLEARAG